MSKLCFLSKRRRNQLIRSRIIFYKNCIGRDSAHDNVQSAISCPKEKSNIEKLIPELSEHISLDSSNIEENCQEHPLTAFNNVEQHTIFLNSSLSSNEDYFSDDENSISQDLNSKLKSWVVEEQIPHKSANALLKILRDYGHNSLPNDIRTLMKTVRKASQHIEQMDNGFYVHFGLLNGLLRSLEIHFEECPDSIKLLINCDGMSLSKSSGSQFWPILVSIYTDIRTEPFPVGIYHGFSKPKDANTYLSFFINEAIEILRNGILYNNKICKVSIAGIVCDAPARAFITCTKSHSGYFSCNKCTQEGEYIKSVIFPELTFTLRTNKSFRSKEQEEHHTGVSLLEKLEIDMVNQIALDYMHLVCLGVMKRLLVFWVKGPKNIRLKMEYQNYICNALLAVRSSISFEFARLPRSLKELDKWKATEFRLFLLYIGPVILKSTMSDVYYTHFLTFSIAIRILCDPKLCIKMNDYAHNLLVYFVNNFKNLYGRQYMSYNIHNLLHLANDVKTFGSLDKFSCFQFENYLGRLRCKVRNSGKPLEQLINRISEENQLPIKNFTKLYKRIHYSKSGKIISVELKEFIISIKNPNNCCLLKNNSVFIVKEIILSNKILYIVGDQFTKFEPLFLQPCNSLNLQICATDEVDSENIIVPITEIERKCLKFIYFGCSKPIIVPIIHND